MDLQARDQMLALLSALNAQDRALRRDGCGDWRIRGTSGHVYTWGDGKTWLLFLACRSARAWTAAKVRLGFCEVTQDGEEEGCFRLHDLPVPDQAVAIRTALGIRKRRINDPLVTEGLRATAKRGFQRQQRPREAGRCVDRTRRSSRLSEAMSSHSSGPRILRLRAAEPAESAPSGDLPEGGVA